jgi:ribosomal protein S18 acetylase RimI-like enzyme
MRVFPAEIHLKNGHTLELRSPEPEEAGPMLEFLRTLFHESSENLSWPADHFDSVPEEEEQAALQKFCDSPTSFMLAAFDGVRPVGNVTCQALWPWVSWHCADLGIGVLKEFQNLGLGTALLGQCLDQAVKIGIWNLRLTVRSFNRPGVKLYERLGFERVGTYKSIARVGDRFVDEHIYQRLDPRRG